MTITFCISGISRNPVGGEKVIYELSNRLCRRNINVNIVSVSGNCFMKTHLPVDARVALCDILTKLKVIPKWFKFDPAVNIITVKDYSSKNFPKSDYIVATAVDTAVGVEQLPSEKGVKLYFIQDFENWQLSNAEVINTYKLGMKNITVSRWLCEFVQQYDVKKTSYISNAIDTEHFNVKVSITGRNKYSIGVLYHPGKHKGFKYLLQALKRVKKKYPQVIVHAFGSKPRPNFLPDWFTYQQSLSPTELSKLYNSCSIFACASIEEGFGLTGAESMACGCALATTGYKGVYEYAVDKKNALISPVKDVDALADNICKLIEDDELRQNLANTASVDLGKRSWGNFIDQFISLL